MEQRSGELQALAMEIVDVLRRPIETPPAAFQITLNADIDWQLTPADFAMKIAAAFALPASLLGVLPSSDVQALTQITMERERLRLAGMDALCRKVSEDYLLPLGLDLQMAETSTEKIQELFAQAWQTKCEPLDGPLMQLARAASRPHRKLRKCQLRKIYAARSAARRRSWRQERKR